MAKPRYAYAEIILSGKPVYMIEGLDYFELPEAFKQRWFDAAKRRGLKLATKTIREPHQGLVIQAYLPGHTRPNLPNPPLSTVVPKNAKQGLYCTKNGCNTWLSANEQKYRECAEHRD